MMIPEIIIEKLSTSKRVAVLTGAGISAESGVPTFRGEGGIWNKLKPEELADFGAFMRNPELVWEWYNMRRNLISVVRPNEGHYALAELEKIFGNGFSIATQNIDNLHRRAGNKNVFELHGNIERSYCVKCRNYYHDIKIDENHKIPKCDCGGLIRPDVVWFGENLPEEEIDKSVGAAESADVYFSIGTSGNVYPAANLPGIAKRNGAFTIEINIERTLISSEFDQILIGRSGEILSEIVKSLEKRRNEN
jgi:NAD-dependent deacetylase